MVILDVSLPTGFTPENSDLERVIKNTNPSSGPAPVSCGTAYKHVYKQKYDIITF